MSKTKPTMGRLTAAAFALGLAGVFGTVALVAAPSTAVARTVKYTQWDHTAQFPCRSGDHCVVPLPTRLRNGYRPKGWRILWHMGRSQGVNNVRVYVDGQLHFNGLPRHKSRLDLPAGRLIEVYVRGTGNKVSPVIGPR